MRKLLNDIKDFLRIVFSNEEYPIEIGETLGKELQAALYNAEVIANGIYGSKETNKQQPNNKLTKGKKPLSNRKDQTENKLPNGKEEEIERT